MALQKESDVDCVAMQEGLDIRTPLGCGTGAVLRGMCGPACLSLRDGGILLEGNWPLLGEQNSQ